MCGESGRSVSVEGSGSGGECEGRVRVEESGRSVSVEGSGSEWRGGVR